MITIQKVYICGLGAIGSAYASLFYEADPNLVSVIADRERIKRYRQRGVTVNGKAYSFRFVDQEAVEGPADLILLAVKQHHLAESIAAIRNFVGPRTIILSLLNGITSETVVGQEFGPDKLLYSFVVGSDTVREGLDTRFSSVGRIVFGEAANQNYSPKVMAVKELFDRAGIPYQIPDNMLRELWWKFMMNVGVNQISAVLKAPYGVFQRVGEARELLKLASGEVLQLAQRLEIELTAEDIQGYLQIIDSLAPEGKTSMLQDIEAGRKTEVEIFAETVVALGRSHGVSTPVNEVLLRMIRTLEQTYQVRII